MTFETHPTAAAKWERTKRALRREIFGPLPKGLTDEEVRAELRRRARAVIERERSYEPPDAA